MKTKQFYLCLAACAMLFFSAMPAAYADEICDAAIAEGKQKYNAGDYQKAKELFEYAKNECGSNYDNAQSWINKCNEALAPTTLSVSRTNVSVGAAAGSTTITVTCNRTWSLKNSSTSFFSVSRNGNTLTITYYANPNTSDRSSYFDIVSNDGSRTKRIYVKQSAKATSSSRNSSSSSSTTPSSTPTSYQISQMNAKINRVWVDHNVYENGQKGMRIHVSFDCNNMLSFKGWCVAWFYNADGTPMKNYSTDKYVNSEHSVGTWTTFTPSYVNSTYSDLKLFIPNSAISGSGQNLYFQVKILEYTQGNFLCSSGKQYFNSSSSYLTLSKTSIYATCSGSTENITVSSSGEWEIRCPSNAWYTVKKMSNTQIRVTINKNTSSTAGRTGYFNVILKDGGKIVKVSLSQSQCSNSQVSSNHYTRTSTYDRYIKGNGKGDHNQKN